MQEHGETRSPPILFLFILHCVLNPSLAFYLILIDMLSDSWLKDRDLATDNVLHFELEEQHKQDTTLIVRWICMSKDSMLMW